MPPDTQEHPTTYEVVDRDRIRFLVRHGPIEIDRLATEGQTHSDLRAFGHRSRLTRLTHDRVDERLLGFLDVIEKGMQDFGPFADREIRPDSFIERPACLRNRPLDLREGRHADFGEAGFIRRVLDLERPLTFDPTARNVRALTVDYLHGSPYQNYVLLTKP